MKKKFEKWRNWKGELHFFLIFSAIKKPLVSVFKEPRISEKSQRTYIHFIFVFEVSSFLGNPEEMAF